MKEEVSAMNTFVLLDNAELMEINGGANGWTILGGVLTVAAGVGLCAAALVPGLNVVAVAGLAYLGSWGVSGGTALAVYGGIVQ
jgi:hypothetical protein